MGYEDDNYKVNKLFVFGAGASFAATRKNNHQKSSKLPKTQIPLDNGFTSALLEVSDDRRLWIGKSLKAITKSWQDHVPFQDMGLEEAMLAQSANMKFSQGTNSQVDFDYYLKHLAHLIAVRLTQAKQGEEKLYNRFAEKFFNNRKTKNRIITFNYDDILDRSLLDNHGHTIRGLYSSNIRAEQQDENFKPSTKRGRMQDSPTMIKMHGSVNWNCTSEDFFKILGQNGGHPSNRSLQGIWYREKGCPAFDEDSGVSPCIIPPIESKPVREIPQFWSFWDKARQYLSECKELYVCGYSLPPTDALARSLFKKFSNTRLKKITVIDPNYSIMAHWRKVLVRPPTVNKVEWSHFEDLGEFVDWINPQ